jgi:hypothetical protein
MLSRDEQHSSVRKLHVLSHTGLDGTPLVVAVVKGSWELGEQGLAPLNEPEPLLLEDRYWGEAGTSSLAREAETAWHKPGSDVVVIGAAHARRSGDREVMVGLRIGQLSRVAQVFGDRMWFRSFLGGGITRPLPFESIPLVWERSFGGRDPAHEERGRPCFEARNPIGRGFRHRASPRCETLLPNVEDPRALLRHFGDRPQPLGFGYVDPRWMPRSAYVGTFDAIWARERKPLLPRDFDLRYHNAAAPGLVHKPYLRGDERVCIEGMSPAGTEVFDLPGLAPPELDVHLRRGGRETLHGVLDTVVLDLIERRVHLLWRACLRVRRGLAAVAHIEEAR